MDDRVGRVIMKVTGYGWQTSCDTDVDGAMCSRCTFGQDGVLPPPNTCDLCIALFGGSSGRFRDMRREDIPLRTVEGLVDPWARFAIRGVVMRMDGRWMSIAAGRENGTAYRACAVCSVVKCLDTDPLYRFCGSLRPNGRSFREVRRQAVLNEILKMEEKP